MKIEWVRFTPFRLSLREKLETAHGSIDAREGVLVQLGAEGVVGHGEASPIAGFGMESRERCADALFELARGQLARPAADFDARIAALEGQQPDAPAARGAVDVALHDLAARIAGKGLSSWLAPAGGRARSHVRVHSLLAGDSPSALAARATEAAGSGQRCLKLKVGARPLDDDVARLAAVRGALGDDSKIRLDANEAYPDDETALRALERFAAYDVELIEQPLAASALGEAARLVARSPIPIAADEAACDERGARAVIDAGAANLLVVKPGACGGLSPARRIVALAREAGLGFFVTSLLDSAVGVAAALHLSASLEGPLAACGLATSSLLREDLFDLPAPERGLLGVPAGPGLGFEVSAERLQRVAVDATQELRA